MTDTVLVTGISGFIASHVAAGLLTQGFAVRGTVRNKVKGERIVEAVAARTRAGKTRSRTVVMSNILPPLFR